MCERYPAIETMLEAASAERKLHNEQHMVILENGLEKILCERKNAESLVQHRSLSIASIKTDPAQFRRNLIVKAMIQSFDEIRLPNVVQRRMQMQVLISP
jgi:hypothetical protein